VSGNKFWTTRATGEEHHECPERSEGCEGSQTKSQSDTHKIWSERSDDERQRHGRHGCDAGVLMPLDEKLFPLREKFEEKCCDWSLRYEVNWCVDWEASGAPCDAAILIALIKNYFWCDHESNTKWHCKKFYDVVTSHRTRNAIRFKFVTSIMDRSDQKLFLITLSWSVSILTHRSWEPKRPGSRNETRKRETIKLRTSNFVDEVIMRARDATESDQRSDVMRSNWPIWRESRNARILSNAKISSWRRKIFG
jgi:hypothetical protein